ncbi:MAG: iron-sulfur cluster-binding domain-containing protein, partial [Pseudomonadota bacterium]
PKLRKIVAKFPQIKYFPVIESPPDGYEGEVGLITGKLILEKIGSTAGKTFFLCGPQGLYDFCQGELAGLGVPGRKIKREVYGPPLVITSQPGWPAGIGPDNLFSIKIDRGPTLTAPAGRPLIQALEKSGYQAPPSICRSGECSMCRVRVLSGQVFQPEGALVRSSDRKYGWVHSCVSYPLSDLEIAF